MLDRRELLGATAAGALGLMLPMDADASAPIERTDRALLVRALHMLHDMLGADFNRNLDPLAIAYPLSFHTTDGQYEYVAIERHFRTRFNENWQTLEEHYLYSAMLSFYRVLTIEPRGKLLFCRRLPVGHSQVEITFDNLSLRLTKQVVGLMEPPIGPKIEYTIDGLYALPNRDSRQVALTADCAYPRIALTPDRA